MMRKQKTKKKWERPNLYVLKVKNTILTSCDKADSIYCGWAPLYDAAHNCSPGSRWIDNLSS